MSLSCEITVKIWGSFWKSTPPNRVQFHFQQGFQKVYNKYCNEYRFKTCLCVCSYHFLSRKPWPKYWVSSTVFRCIGILETSNFTSCFCTIPAALLFIRPSVGGPLKVCLNSCSSCSGLNVFRNVSTPKIQAFECES